MESKNLLNSYKAYIVSEYNNSGEFIKYCVTIKDLNISFNLYFKGEASLEFLNKQIKSNLINYLQGKEIEDLSTNITTVPSSAMICTINLLELETFYIKNRFDIDIDKRNTVRKTLTIPRYLCEMGETEGINFSEFITESLKDNYSMYVANENFKPNMNILDFENCDVQEEAFSIQIIHKLIEEINAQIAAKDTLLWRDYEDTDKTTLFFMLIRQRVPYDKYTMLAYRFIEGEVCTVFLLAKNNLTDELELFIVNHDFDCMKLYSLPALTSTLYSLLQHDLNPITKALKNFLNH